MDVPDAFNSEITFENLRSLIVRDIRRDNYPEEENLVKEPPKKQELPLDEIGEKIQILISNSPEEVIPNIQLIDDLFSLFSYDGEYPQEIISPDFLSILFTLLSTENQDYYSPVFKLISKICYVYDQTNIYELFPHEVIEMIMNISKSTQLTSTEKRLGFETVIAIALSSCDAVDYCLPLIADIFVTAKALSNITNVQVKFVAYLRSSCKKMSCLREMYDDQFFVDVLDEIYGWDANTIDISAISVAFFEMDHSIIDLMYTSDDGVKISTFITRIFCSLDKRMIIGIIPLVEYIFESIGPLNNSVIELMVSTIAKYWKDEKCSKDIWRFTRVLTEKIDDIVLFLTKEEFVDVVGLIFGPDSPINGEAKIDAAKALCIYVVKAEPEVLDSVDCDQIMEVIDDVEDLPMIEQDLVEEARAKISHEED